jgi:hypothetical protein
MIECSVYSIATKRMCRNVATGSVRAMDYQWPACDEHKDPPPPPMHSDPIDRIRAECGLPVLHG